MLVIICDEPEFAARDKKVAERLHDLTPFIVVNHLGITDLGVRLCRAVYHPSSSLSRKQGVTKEPLLLLKNVRGLELLS